MSKEKEVPWTKYIQPAGMTLASSVNLMAAAGHLLFQKSEDTHNPFYFATMFTSAVYIASNGYAVSQVYASRCVADAANQQPNAAIEVKQISNMEEGRGR